MHFACQCKTNSISGPAQLNAVYWFSYVTLSKPHKVKGFHLFVGVLLYFISAQCATFMYTCLCHFKGRMIVVTFSMSKIGLYWQQLQKNENRHRREKHYSVPWLLWAGWSMFSFVEVSGCMSPRLHPSFVLSPFFWARSHTHTSSTHSPLPPTQPGMYLVGG